MKQNENTTITTERKIKDKNKNKTDKLLCTKYGVKVKRHEAKWRWDLIGGGEDCRKETQKIYLHIDHFIKRFDLFLRGFKHDDEIKTK